MTKSIDLLAACKTLGMLGLHMPKKKGTTPWLARPGRLSAYETQEYG